MKDDGKGQCGKIGKEVKDGGKDCFGFRGMAVKDGGEGGKGERRLEVKDGGEGGKGEDDETGFGRGTEVVGRGRGYCNCACNCTLSSMTFCVHCKGRLSQYKKNEKDVSSSQIIESFACDTNINSDCTRPDFSETNPTLKMLCLNTCGLASKIDFIDLCIDNSDILIFTETKTDITSETVITDHFDVRGYKTFFKHRRELSTFKSGGIAFCINEKIAAKCNIIKSKCRFVHWCKIDKSILGTEKDILLGGVYAPPEGSIYASQTCINEIESDIVNFTSVNDLHIVLAGDFNAHVSTASDLTDADSHMIQNEDSIIKCSISNVQFIANCVDYSDILKKYGLSPSRKSEDKSRINNFGNSLLNLCKSLSLFIYNGRIGEDGMHGAVTNIKANTIVDYCVSDTELIPFIKNFKVCDFDPLVSDLHCPLSISFYRRTKRVHETSNNKDTTTTISPTSPPYISSTINWDNNIKSCIQTNISQEKIEILENLEESDADASTVYEALKNTLLDACSKCGIVKKNKRQNGNRNSNHAKSKQWFDKQCFEARTEYKKVKVEYSKVKSNLRNSPNDEDRHDTEGVKKRA